MANTIQGVVYTSDLGVRYVIGMNSEVFAQNNTAGTPVRKVGGEDYDGTEAIGPMPANIRPRQVRLVNPAGKIRYVVALDSDAPIWGKDASNGNFTLNLEDSDGASTVYTKNGTLGEKSRRRH